MSTVYLATALPPAALARLDAADIDYRSWASADEIVADQLIDAVANAEALISAVDVQVPAEVIDAAPKLELIANVGDGFSNIDLNACRRRGIAVTNAPAHDSIASTAELAVTVLLTISRRILPGDKLMRDGGFSGWRVTGYVGGHPVCAGQASWIRANGRASSSSYDSSSRVRSPPRSAEKWMPIGMPADELPSGREIAGVPHELSAGVKAT